MGVSLGVNGLPVIGGSGERCQELLYLLAQNATTAPSGAWRRVGRVRESWSPRMSSKGLDMGWYTVVQIMLIV